MSVRESLPVPISAVLDELTYSSYRTQRLTAPHISPERWGLIFKDWKALEARYQGERLRGNVDTETAITEAERAHAAARLDLTFLAKCARCHDWNNGEEPRVKLTKFGRKHYCETCLPKEQEAWAVALAEDRERRRFEARGI